MKGSRRFQVYKDFFLLLGDKSRIEVILDHTRKRLYDRPTLNRYFARVRCVEADASVTLIVFLGSPITNG